MHGEVCILLLVRSEDAIQVHAREHIAVEDHDGIMAQLIVDVANAAAGAQSGLLDDVLNVEPELRTVAEVFLEDLCLKRRGQYDVLDARGLDARQQVLEERGVRRGQHRLRRTDCQGAQTRTAATHEDDCVYCRSNHEMKILVFRDVYRERV